MVTGGLLEGRTSGARIAGAIAADAGCTSATGPRGRRGCPRSPARPETWPIARPPIAASNAQPSAAVGLGIIASQYNARPNGPCARAFRTLLSGFYHEGEMSVGIGLIGCGQWGLNYLRAFSELEGCQVVAACDISQDRLREASRRNRDVRTTTDLSEIIANPDVDAVIIATQATRHYA